RPPLSPPPPSSQQVSFADKWGKQSVCKLVRLPHGTNKFIDREGNSERRLVTIDPTTRRVD
ncbi:hypothetical protein HOY80DRAFT_854906, partial [Tuber brumale]